MRRSISYFILFIVLLSVSLPAPAQTKKAPKPSESAKSEVLTNESIISLVKAQFKEKTIISLLRTSQVDFDLSAPKLIQLKRNGVNETVIQAMIERQAMASSAFALRDDEFFNSSDDEFFRSAPKLSLPELKREAPRSGNSQEQDIFGSRSGNQSRSQSRGGLNGERSGSSEITGSATVRIIKPPTESGDPRLERAPRLTNQNIIDMVQAGFSEGTILRKIEITQVEFDLSSQAIETLRKNRVSDKVVKAMQTAMDESK